MTIQEFKSSLHFPKEPTGLPPFLMALWNDAKGKWKEAHSIVQDIDTQEGAWIHAYLHRKEGDDTNARYWYGRAAKKFPKVSLEGEWRELVSYFVADLKI